MAKPIKEIVKDLGKANDAYHMAVEELLECESLNVEQRAKIGADAFTIFDCMKKLNRLLDNYMS